MRQLISVLFLVILVAAAGLYTGWFLGIKRVDEARVELAAKESALSTRVSDLEGTLLLLAGETVNLRAGILAQEEYAKGETAKKEELAAALAKLSGTVSEQKNQITTLAKTSDVSGIIKTWSPFVYDITCTFESADETSEGSGSAVVQNGPGGTRFITSRHIIEKDGGELIECTLDRPGNSGEIEVSASRITNSTERDIAYGEITESVPAMQASQICTSEPEIGDSVVMLGYPTIGAEESVTATEGIISGFDEDYYTTSAKIERGNSGGAAVHVLRNCFMGLPTLVFAGRIESLARILPITEL